MHYILPISLFILSVYLHISTWHTVYFKDRTWVKELILSPRIWIKCIYTCFVSNLSLMPQRMSLSVNNEFTILHQMYNWLLYEYRTVWAQFNRLVSMIFSKADCSAHAECKLFFLLKTSPDFCSHSLPMNSGPWEPWIWGIVNMIQSK